PETSVRTAAGPITTGDRTRPAGLRVGGRARCEPAAVDRWTGGGAPSLAFTGVRAMATLTTSRTRTVRAVRGRGTIPPVGGGSTWYARARCWQNWDKPWSEPLFSSEGVF